MNCFGTTIDNKGVTVNAVNKSSANVLFWVLAPALFPLLVAPLAMGHVVVRLMIARMRRRPGAAPAWRSPMLRGLTTTRS
jgi:hypothetical protein